MKKITLICLSFLIVGFAFGQTIQSTFTYNGDNILRADRGGSCGSAIPNYTNIPDGLNGNPSQDFAAANDAFDSKSADDFEISAEGTICQIAVTGSVTGAGFDADPNSAIIIEIWEDDAGLPGTMIYTETLPAAGLDPGLTGDFAVFPTGGPVLVPGTKYYLSVIVRLEFALGGQWFWDSSSDGSGNVWAFENAGDGFGTGCTTWNLGTTCLGVAEVDRSMDIAFEENLSVDDDALAANVKLYPNPTNGDLNINFARSLGSVDLNIVNVNGQIVMNKSLEAFGSSSIDTSKLANGVYFAQISSDEGSTAIKFIKN